MFTCKLDSHTHTWECTIPLPQTHTSTLKIIIIIIYGGEIDAKIGSVLLIKIIKSKIKVIIVENEKGKAGLISA